MRGVDGRVALCSDEVTGTVWTPVWAHEGGTEVEGETNDADKEYIPRVLECLAVREGILVGAPRQHEDRCWRKK